MALSLPGQVSNLEIVRNGIWSFSKGFADSLRGAIELFFLDYKRAQQREQKLQQRDIDRELLLNRNSPVREVQNIAKRRALERRSAGEAADKRCRAGAGEFRVPAHGSSFADVPVLLPRECGLGRGGKVGPCALQPAVWPAHHWSEGGTLPRS